MSTLAKWTDPAKYATLESAGYCLHAGEWSLDGASVGNLAEAMEHYEERRERNRRVWAETLVAFGAMVGLALVVGALIVWAYVRWGGGL